MSEANPNILDVIGWDMLGFASLIANLPSFKVTGYRGMTEYRLTS